MGQIDVNELIRVVSVPGGTESKGSMGVGLKEEGERPGLPLGKGGSTCL